MTAEHKIQNDIRVALSKHKCTVFRVNVGSVKTPDGRFFSAGVPSGHPDLYGFRWSDHQVFYIEVKNEKGKPRADQIKFHNMLASHGIIHGICRSADDALKVVTDGLIGYGFDDYGGEKSWKKNGKQLKAMKTVMKSQIMETLGAKEQNT